MTTPSFLKTKGTAIVDGNGRRVHLRGTNFGGWLMMEAYFMHAPNTAEQLMKKEFAKKLGAKALRDMEVAFRQTFIQESDMRQVAQWGFNCVRLPFNYRILEEGDIKYIDEAIRWAKIYGVYLILDLHAAPGSQNKDWHSDSLGKAELWTKKSNRTQTYKIWEMLADRYKDEPIIAGYDLLNESVMDDTDLLNEFYREVIKVIRKSDRNHILFIEGNRWAQDIHVLDDFNDDNWAFSIHFYEPLEFTFTLVPGMHYPIKSATGVWDKNIMIKRMETYAEMAKHRGRPVNVGEFGVHYRDGYYGEDKYVKDLVSVFKQFDFHWNYWPYKCIKHYMFPDGIMSYYPNPAWVFRQGPETGWNRWKDTWTDHKQEMINSWKTDAFTTNTKILAALGGE